MGRRVRSKPSSGRDFWAVLPYLNNERTSVMQDRPGAAAAMALLWLQRRRRRVRLHYEVPGPVVSRSDALPGRNAPAIDIADDQAKRGFWYGAGGRKKHGCAPCARRHKVLPSCVAKAAEPAPHTATFRNAGTGGDIPKPGCRLRAWTRRRLAASGIRASINEEMIEPSPSSLDGRVRDRFNRVMFHQRRAEPAAALRRGDRQKRAEVPEQPKRPCSIRAACCMHRQGEPAMASAGVAVVSDYTTSSPCGPASAMRSTRGTASPARTSACSRVMPATASCTCSTAMPRSQRCRRSLQFIDSSTRREAGAAHQDVRRPRCPITRSRRVHRDAAAAGATGLIDQAEAFAGIRHRPKVGKLGFRVPKRQHCRRCAQRSGAHQEIRCSRRLRGRSPRPRGRSCVGAAGGKPPRVQSARRPRS